MTKQQEAMQLLKDTLAATKSIDQVANHRARARLVSLNRAILIPLLLDLYRELDEIVGGYDPVIEEAITIDEPARIALHNVEEAAIKWVKETTGSHD